MKAPGAVRPAARTRLPKPPRPRPRKWMPIWRYAFLICAGTMIVVTAVGVGAFMGYVRTLPPIERLEYYEPAQVSVVTDRTGQQAIGEFKETRRYVVPISQIPRRLQLAFLAIEDSRFYDHIGVDPKAILRALIVLLTTGTKSQGGSTITQQLTRNILPDEVGFKKTISRKIKEAILSLEIERRYSKDQILEFYLNHIAFLYNAFGVKAAASVYFSKDLDQLTLAECATLATMPRNPTIYNPFTKPDRTLERRNLVLKRMLDLNYIGEQAYNDALKEPLAPRRGFGAPSLYPYFLDALGAELRRRYGMSDAQLNKGGYRVTATVDGQVEQICDDALKNGLIKVERQWQKIKPDRHVEETKHWDGSLKPGDILLFKIDSVGDESINVSLDDFRGTIPLPDELPFYEPANVIAEGEWIDIRIDSVQGRKIEGRLADKRPVQGAIVALDAHSGEVLGLVGGSNYYSPNGGKFNLATQGGRQPGSALKPLFYAAAMERGIEPNTIIVDEPIEYGSADRPYRPINYEKDFEGPMTLVKALEHSRNVVTIRLYEALGIRKALDMVKQFDFSDEKSNWTLPPEMSTCLGTIDSTPLQIAAAYQAIANNGVGVRPEFLASLQSKNGQTAMPIKRWEEPILDPVAAYQTLYMMRQVVIGGTGKTYVGDEFPSPPYPPIAGKTGTTTDNLDCWFAGFTPDIVLVVQVGFDPPRPLGPTMTGGKVAGPIWADAMRGILKTRKNWSMRFDIPEGVELADICSETGKLASDVCRDRDHQIFHGVPFRQGKAPTESCNDTPLQPLIAPVGDQYADEASHAPVNGIARRPSIAFEPGVGYLTGANGGDASMSGANSSGADSFLRR